MRVKALEFAQKVTLSLMTLIAGAIVLVAIRGVGNVKFWASIPPAPPVNVAPAAHAARPETPQIEVQAATVVDTPTIVKPEFIRKGPRPVQIGIIAGHYQNDSGAICPDGLREVDINLAVAERVVARLKRKGYAVDLFGEFDPRLKGYQADVLVSLHSDSCDTWGLSGFKIARSMTSGIPDIEDKLVSRLSNGYQNSTGLSFQADTITDDMRDYHAFREVAVTTPAAIIELGFMSNDRDMLLYRQDRLAKGIVDGLQCFLDSQKTP